MAKSEGLTAAVDRLAQVTGWTPDRAAKHVAAIADELADKAEQKAKVAAQKVVDKRR